MTKTRTISIGGLTVDQANFRVCVNGVETPMQYQRFKLLLLLVTHVDELVSPDRIWLIVWGDKQPISLISIRVAVAYLRKALKPASPVHIETKAKLGYMLRSGTTGRPLR